MKTMGISGLALCVLLVGLWLARWIIEMPSSSAANPSETVQSRAYTPVSADRGPINDSILPAMSAPAALEEITDRPAVQSDASLESLKELIALKRQFRYPPPRLILGLTNTDEREVLDLYSGEVELTNKLAYTWALAACGGENSVSALIRTLEAEYLQLKLNVHASQVVCDSIRALGVLSAQSDRAFQFLQTATSPDYWRKTRTWLSRNDSVETGFSCGFRGLCLE